MRQDRRKAELLYRIQCEDSRGIENACPAFLFAPTSHWILYKSSAFLFFGARWNQYFCQKKRGLPKKFTAARLEFGMKISRRNTLPVEC